MVTVSFTETYDLSTKTNKMTLIGIHTPTKGIFQRLYPGFLMQYSKCKILSQDVAVACASMLPADPLQVGIVAGDIAPEDLFNPILYKAMTNDSWSTLEARIAGLNYFDEDGLSAQGYSAEVSKEHSTPFADEFGVYYSLLSDRRGWRVANPQAGLTMSSLRPLVFEHWYTDGINTTEYNGNYSAVLTYDSDATQVQRSFALSKGLRGNAHPMPAFNTTFITASDADGTAAVNNGMQQVAPDGTASASGSPANSQTEMPDLPKVMTAAIIVPPSRLHQLYYRMTVTTTVEFFDPRSMVDVATLGGLNYQVYPAVYFKDYTFSSKLLPNETSSVDVSEDASISKIMESQK